jgi:catechol 2,3-dioxygenase-like lactoylglutathione lyase family enzyme
MAQLEHVNLTVSDLHRTAAWMKQIFGWKVRWEGEVLGGAGHTIHIGTEDAYLAIYTPRETKAPAKSTYTQRGGLNHVGVTVDDIDSCEERVKAAGFTPGKHADYEPGQRFYFDDHDGIEYEVVSYA